MYSKQERKIIAETSCLFFIGQEYEMINKRYSYLIEQVDDFEIHSIIDKLEENIKEKIELEIISSYFNGAKFGKNQKIDFHNNVLFMEIENILNTNNLYNESNKYHNICDNIKEITKNLFDKSKTNETSKIIELLLEIYSDCSYELIKLSFIIGYSLNISYSDIELNTVQTTIDKKGIIGKKITCCRKIARLTQQELGDKFNINRSNISYYELGKVMPPLEILLQYAKTFDIEINDLIDRNVSLDAFLKKYYKIC